MTFNFLIQVNWRFWGCCAMSPIPCCIGCGYGPCAQDGRHVRKPGTNEFRGKLPTVVHFNGKLLVSPPSCHPLVTPPTPKHTHTPPKWKLRERPIQTNKQTAILGKQHFPRAFLSATHCSTRLRKLFLAIIGKGSALPGDPGCCFACCSIEGNSFIMPEKSEFPYSKDVGNQYTMDVGDGAVNCAVPPCANGGCNCCPCCPTADYHFISWLEK